MRNGAARQALSHCQPAAGAQPFGGGAPPPGGHQQLQPAYGGCALTGSQPSGGGGQMHAAGWGSAAGGLQPFGGGAPPPGGHQQLQPVKAGPLQMSDIAVRDQGLMPQPQDVDVHPAGGGVCGSMEALVAGDSDWEDFLVRLLWARNRVVGLQSGRVGEEVGRRSPAV